MECFRADAPTNHLSVKTGGDDELCAHGNSQFALIQVQNCTGTNQYIGAVFCNSLDGIGSGSGTESDFHDINTPAAMAFAVGTASLASSMTTTGTTMEFANLLKTSPKTSCGSVIYLYKNEIGTT